jgi:hypothetical protein
MTQRHRNVSSFAVATADWLVKLFAMPAFPFAFLPRILRFVSVVFALITFTTAKAPASTLWQWEYSGPAITAAGTFTTVDSPDANGGYLITGITGTRNGITIIGLQASGTSIPGNEPYVVDNLVFLGSGPQLTSNGFGFSTADGASANPFYADFLPAPGYLEFFSTPGLGSSELPVQFSATLVAVPEPATWGLVLGALAGISVRRHAKFRFFL